MEFKNVLLEVKENIAFITINRESKLNALNTETILELTCLFEGLYTREDVRVAIITGAGSKAFVAGADISEMANMTVLEAKEFANRGHKLMNTIENAPFPVIAAVNGFALGGGSEIALACDFIYASDKAKFGLPEVGLGVFPGFGGTQRLTKRIGTAKAKELILSGEMIDACTAVDMGIANRVVEADKLMEEVTTVAKKIASKAPYAVKLAKELIEMAASTDIKRGLKTEADYFSLCFATEDQKEGMKAFLDKKKPEFKGR
ncbi:MAG: enoyl-CoA hydratase-related protein [bacterium]